MPSEIFNNKYGTSVCVRAWDANATVNVAGNSTNSDLAVGDEIVNRVTLTRVVTGGDADAVWQIEANSNSVGMFGGNYDFNLKDGLSIQVPPGALSFNLISGNNSMIIVELKKS